MGNAPPASNGSAGTSKRSRQKPSAADPFGNQTRRQAKRTQKELERAQKLQNDADQRADRGLSPVIVTKQMPSLKVQAEEKRRDSESSAASSKNNYSEEEAAFHIKQRKHEEVLKSAKAKIARNKQEYNKNETESQRHERIEFFQNIRDNNRSAIAQKLATPESFQFVHIVRDENGSSPLHIAAECGHVKLCDIFLKASSDVDMENGTGQTPLFSACKAGHLEVVKLLLKHDADPNHPKLTTAFPLYTACASGFLDIAQELVENKADVNKSKSDGTTAAWIASAFGQTDVLKYLIQQKAHIHVRKVTSGASALWVATQENHYDCAQLLLKHKIDVNLPKRNGASPLWIAAANGHLGMSKLLLEHKADVNAADQNNTTPVWIACQEGSYPIVHMLLHHGADPNIAQARVKMPCIMTAAQNGHVEIVRVLLQYHANPNQRRADGAAPLVLAAHNDHSLVVDLLCSAKAMPNLLCQLGGKETSPLWTACAKNNHEVVQLLLMHKADANMECQGYTPMEVAVKKEAEETIRVLNGESTPGRPMNMNTSGVPEPPVKSKSQGNVKASLSAVSLLKSTSRALITARSTKEIVAEGPPCSLCGQSAEVGHIVQYRHHIWHKSCFKCAFCHTQLRSDGAALVKDNLSCKVCFIKLYQNASKQKLTKGKVAAPMKTGVAAPPPVYRADSARSNHSDQSWTPEPPPRAESWEPNPPSRLASDSVDLQKPLPADSIVHQAKSDIAIDPDHPVPYQTRPASKTELVHLHKHMSQSIQDLNKMYKKRGSRASNLSKQSSARSLAESEVDSEAPPVPVEDAPAVPGEGVDPQEGSLVEDNNDDSSEVGEEDEESDSDTDDDLRAMIAEQALKVQQDSQKVEREARKHSAKIDVYVQQK